MNRNLRDNTKITVSKHRVTKTLQNKEKGMKQKIYLKVKSQKFHKFNERYKFTSSREAW